MTNVNPFNLPEIIFRLTDYLTFHDMARCLRVSKAWYHIFLPLVWKDIAWRKIQRNGQRKALTFTKTYEGPPPEYLERHRQFVYNLRVDYRPPKKFAFTYPNLQKLFYRGNPTLLLKLNPTLVELELMDHANGRFITPSCWEILLKHQTHLKKLFLQTAIIRKNGVKNFWKVCEKLEALHLALVSIEASSVFVSTTFPQIRYLSIGRSVTLNGADPLDLIRKCPGLQHLHCQWSPNDIASYFKTKTWPNLHSLALHNNLSDDELALILQEIRQATNIDLRVTGFGPLAFRVLNQRHFPTLTFLDLLNCPSVTSVMIQDVLCSCPRLETLKADHVLAIDIVKGGPWVCRYLSTLFLHIKFTKSDQILQPQIFDRLSSLVYLRLLSIGVHNFSSNRELTFGLDMRLGRGLQALVNLKYLEHVSFNGTIQYMGEEEANWIVVNWRVLSKIFGTKNTEDPDVNRKVEAILKRHGINHLDM